MMKNKKMGILAVLVMLVAVSLNAVGGTYAKYISSYGTTDEARVAKWDFNDESTKTVDLFQNSYTKVTDGENPEKYAYVASSDAWKVIAPGTEGEFGYKVSGTAETNFRVTQVLKIENEVKLDNGYDPLEFSIDGKEIDDETKVWVKSSDITDIDNTTVYPANAFIEIGGNIAWRWVFETNNDANDTVLGAKAVDEDLTVKVTITSVIEQTQDAPTAYVDTAGDAVAADYARLTNRLSDEDKTALVGIGYRTDNASTTFNGRTLSGSVRAYDNDDKLVEWFGVDDSTRASNYFVALNITVPAGTTLKNLSAYEGPKVVKQNTSDEDVVITNVINVKSLNGTFEYSLVDRNGQEFNYEIAYDLTVMAN